MEAPKDYEVFWDNGKWVAIRNGTIRRNIAPYNCQTKTEAIQAAREDRDDLRQAGVSVKDAK